jgi:hypothetical protein
MTTTSDDVPDVTATELDRADLDEAARELGLEDTDELDDQELFERVGRQLGQIADETRPDDDSEHEKPVDTESGDTESGDTESGDTEAEDADTEAEDADTEAEEADGATEPEDAEADTGPDDDTEPDDGEDDVEATTIADAGEYRFEDDPREGVEPVLDLELGPVALDVLGVEVHLKRVHAALTANPNGNRNVIGKLLAKLSQAAAGAGGDDDAEGSDSEDEGGGVLHTLTAPARGLARGVKRTFSKD